MIAELKRFRPVRGRIVAITALSVVTAQIEAAVLVLLVPLASTLAEDGTTYDASVGPIRASLTVAQLTGIIVVGVVIALLLTILQTWLCATAVARWQNQARQSMIRDWLNSDWSSMSAGRAGELTTLTSYALRGAGVLSNFTALLRSGFTLVVFLVTAFMVSARAALVLVVTGIALSAMLRPLVHRVRAGSHRLAQLGRQFNDELIEMSARGRDIKVFDAAATFDQLSERRGNRIERHRARQALLSGLTQPLYQYVGLLLGVLAVYVVAAGGETSIETVGAVALLLIRSLSYGQATQSSYQSVVEQMPFLDAADSYQRALQDAAEPDGHVTLAGVDTVEFDDVSFSYAQGSVPALRSVSLTMRPGEIVGLVGRSGSGKSTLAQLLLRLRRPGSGRVLVNGRPAEDFTMRSWRRRVTLVPQDIALLRGSLHENIAFFDPAVERADVVRAAEAAGLSEVIASLDDGLDTEVGPGSRDLSGGQVQRVGIARALVRSPEVLVLDEPTSALDVHSEAVIHETIERLRDQMLVVVIAHRPSTLTICDRLVVLVDGEVKYDGSVEGVLSESQYFRHFEALIANDGDPGAPSLEGAAQSVAGTASAEGRALGALSTESPKS